MGTKIKYVVADRYGIVSLHKDSCDFAKYLERRDKINNERTDLVCPHCKIENTIFNSFSTGGAYELNVCAKCGEEHPD